MIYKTEEKSIHDIKTPGLNNPESYVLTHNRFNTCLVLIFIDLNKTQIYKVPNRDSSRSEIEIVMSFDSLILFKPNEHTENYHIRKPNEESFLFKIEDKNYIFVGDKVVTFETNDRTLNYSSKSGFNDIKFSLAYSDENIYFMLHEKYFTIQEHESSSEEDEYQYLEKKKMN